MKRMIILAAALGSLMAAQALSDTATPRSKPADDAACTVGDCGSCPLGPDCGSCGGCSMADAAHQSRGRRTLGAGAKAPAPSSCPRARA